MSQVTGRDFTEIDQFESATMSNKVIEVKSVYKTGKHTIQPAFNSNTGWYAGVARLSEEEKKGMTYFVTVGETDKSRAHLNTKLALKDGLIFDLNKEVDALNWKWVRECKEVAMSFKEAQAGKALFYVHIDGREAEVSNANSDLMFDAMKCIMDDPSTNYPNRALLLGMEMDGEPTAVIKEYLLERARKKPMSILRVYRDKSVKVNLLFVKGKQAGKIKINPADGVVKFGEIILGVSDESSIAYLQQNPDIMELLERDVNPQYFEAQKVKSEKKETPLERSRRVKKEEKEAAALAAEV